MERSSSELGTSDQPEAQDGDLIQNARPMAEAELYGDSSTFESVLQSEIGVNTLLVRLKQSIASARDFAAFLKKRSVLEEEHAQGLKKLCKSTHDAIRRPDSRQGSYLQNYEKITRIHDRMAENGIQFALTLHQMHEDLQELANDKEKGRKQWKQMGLSAEKKAQDAESAMEKAKVKYDSLAEDYDRARTGDRQSGRVFGLKGVKSAVQVEEDLHRKVQAADSDYSSKVQVAHSLRQELISILRPQAVKAIQGLINECDSGLTLQLQKFASFNEKLLLSNGLCVSPLKGREVGSESDSSLRDIVYQIDTAQDLKDFVNSFAPKVERKPVDLKYERHPTLQSATQPVVPMTQTPQQTQLPRPQQPPISNSQISPPPQLPAHDSDYNLNSGPLYMQNNTERNFDGSPKQQVFPPSIPNGPSQFSPSQQQSIQPTPPTAKILANQNGVQAPELPPLKPVFGVSLEDLFKRDGSAVPMVVYQCLYAVDHFGLEVEGIYRLSGTASHIMKLRSIFDHDSTQVDFRNPENFYHDVNSVAGLLKQFFRDLPDPLLTQENYHGFIEAARIDDDITRRDSLHATINSLPDPNYATLRALILHLNRVQEHSAANRMNAGNLAICFGPTLMGSDSGPNIADAGWQVRVIDTILQNTYQIFDDD